jgi:hypothetical protein
MRVGVFDACALQHLILFGQFCDATSVCFMDCFEFFDSDVLLGLTFFSVETDEGFDRKRFFTQEVGLLRRLCCPEIHSLLTSSVTLRSSLQTRLSLRSGRSQALQFLF